MTPDLDFSFEVRSAMEAGAPVVALESAIIAHGMPIPQNIETVRSVEATIRKRGATPATIAVIDGRMKIGLDDTELDAFGRATGVAKLSRADMATCIATGGTGATTVAATMIAAHLAGIEVFATGGIGGVHKGAEASFDVSADLHEIAQTPVTVVAAGAKAILDIPKTLEVLETLGVPVIAYGQDTFPAFWSQSSGIKAPIRMDDAITVARSHRIRAALGVSGGQLIANPIPAEDEIPVEELDSIIAAAARDAAGLDVTGKAVTPFLLSRIFDLTDGASLKANIALVMNNARLAAEIAVSLRSLK